METSFQEYNEYFAALKSSQSSESRNHKYQVDINITLHFSGQMLQSSDQAVHCMLTESELQASGWSSLVEHLFCVHEALSQKKGDCKL